MKIFVESATSVTDPSMQRLVKQDTEGRFYIDLPDPKPNDSPAPDPRLDEFRTNNIDLKKQIEEMQKKYADIDPDQIDMIKASMEKAKTDKERELIKQGKFDDVFQLRLTDLQSSHKKALDGAQARIQATEKKLGTFHSALQETRVLQHLQDEAHKNGVSIAPTAHRDVISRALDYYSINDDAEVVAVQSDGTPIVNKEHQPFTAKDFFQELADTAPHLIGQPKGPGPRENTSPMIRNGVLVIEHGDQKGFGSNLEDIAKGKVEVKVQGS